MAVSTIAELQIITTPTLDWLSERAIDCRSQLLIASPFVNDGIFGLTKVLDASVSRTLVTRTDLRNFAIGSSNLETLCELAREGVSIRSLHNLHAKIYIFDTTCALVSSANATHAGLRHNLECGLATTDVKVIQQLRRQLLRGFSADTRSRAIAEEELESLKKPLSEMKLALPAISNAQKERIETDFEDVHFSISDKVTFLQGFSGWLKLTLQGVIELPDSTFRLGQLVDICTPVASSRYPRNRHVPDKLRQQLQIMRDRGLVEFLQRGLYRRTFVINDHA